MCSVNLKVDGRTPLPEQDGHDAYSQTTRSVPNGIFLLISFAILKNPFANPLKKVANLLMEFAMFLS